MRTRLSLRGKIVALSLAAPLAMVVLVAPVVAWQYRTVGQRVDLEIDESNKGQLRQVALDVRGLCETVDESARHQNEAAMKLLRRVAGEHGAVEARSGEVLWRAANQFTQEVAEVRIPRLTFGRSWLGQVRATSERVPVVDDVTDLTGGVTATIFQRMNEQGDMLRVATSVTKADGTRAIGTYIPAVEPDGKPNPVLAAARTS